MIQGIYPAKKFFKRENLQSTRRRSASCPNLEHIDSRNELDSDAKDGLREDTSSESEQDSKEPVSKLERLQAQRSIRRMRQKEKEKMENSVKNLLSMDDYLGKLTELKIWLKEEKHKEPDTMPSPKLKTHFKTFIRLWNKRKLPPKYYRTCSVDLEAADRTLDLDTEIVEESATPRYPLLEDPKLTSPVLSHCTMDPISGNALVCREVGKAGQNAASESPFSTFGKVIEAEPLSGLSSREIETQKKSLQQDGQDKGNNHCTREDANAGYFAHLSPTKFATISRSTPTRGTFRSVPSLGVQATGSARLYPVSSPQCPVVTPAGKFSTRPLPETPTSTKPESDTLLQPSQEDNQNVSPADRERLVSGWNLASKQSPVYASIKDAIPYSSGSPKYAEIDESGIPRVIPSSGDKKTTDLRNSSEGINTKRIVPIKQLDNDYCSLSPPSMKQVSISSSKKSTVGKKSSLNRRRSKSMEDIYAMPIRSEPLFERRLVKCEEESSTEGELEPPPVPERNFSPQSLFESFLGIRTKKITPQKSAGPSGTVGRSPILASAKKKESPQKRRSQENAEASGKTSPPKKIKAERTSHSGTNEDGCDQDCLDGPGFPFEKTGFEPETPSKLSILTGSLKPTTRSAQKTGPKSAPSDSNEATRTNSRSDLNKKDSLEVLEVKQLEESPKFPRRRLKRRSSSFSVTPGKGLTFGKSTKMSTSSPRRVSFAKDVKDTESTSTPRRRSSTRRNVMSTAGNAVTRQTQESLNFQSFLSSHISPPHPNTGKVQVIATNSGKPSSPIKTSLTNLLGNLKKKPEHDDVSTVSSQESESSTVNTETVPRGPAFGEGSSVKVDPLLHQNIEDGRNLFPPSSTRQVGRRVLGSPIKHSYVAQPHQFSQFSLGQKDFKPRQAAVVSPSKKPILHAFMAKLSSKTSILCADEVRDSDGYSSSDDLIDQNYKGASYRESKDSHGLSTSLPSSNNAPTHALSTEESESGQWPRAEQNYNSTPQSFVSAGLKITSPRAFTDGPVLRFDMTPEEPTEFTSHVKLDFEDQSRAGDVKAFARVAKIWNRTVGFDASVDPFVRKTEQASEVVDDSKTTGKGLWPRYVNAASKELWSGKANLTRAESRNQSMREKPLQDSCVANVKQKHEGTPAKGDLSFILPPYPESDPAPYRPRQDIDTMVNPDPPSQEESSFTLPPYLEVSEPVIDDNCLFKTNQSNASGSITDSTCASAEPSSHNESSLPPPYCPEDFKLYAKENCLSNTDPGIALSSDCSDLCTTEQSFILPPYPEESGEVTMNNKSTCMAEKDAPSHDRTHQITSSFGRCRNSSFSLPPSSEAPPPLVSCEETPVVKDSTLASCLQRMESLKQASPKVVENDSWITERRRSNRHSRGQRSFCSTYNHYLLQSSAKSYSNNGAASDLAFDHTQGASDRPAQSHYDAPKKVDNHYDVPRKVDAQTEESASIAISENAQVTPSPQIKAPTTNSTPANNLPTPKPATLPKSARAKNFAQKRLNVQNFIGASSSSSRPIPKRRSSLTKSHPHKTSHTPKDFISKNINAVKTKKEDEKSPVSVNSVSVKAENTVCHIVNRDTESKRINKDCKPSPSYENPRSKPMILSAKLSVFNQADKVPRKRSSIGERNVVNRRRRSKSQGVEEENQMSFSERRKFFQQLQANKSRSPMKVLRSDSLRNAGPTLPSKPSLSRKQPGLMGDTESAATPKSLRSQIRQVPEFRGLVLSPNSNLEI